MKSIFTSVLVLFSLSIWAQPDLRVQTDEIAQINDLENIVRQFNYMRNTTPKELHIEGSAYLEEEFEEGIVALTTGAAYQKIPLRLNVYNEEIEFRNPAGKVFNINNPESIRELIIGEKKFVYTDFKSNHGIKKVLAEVIEEGNVSLLKHHRVKLTEGRAQQTHRAAQPPRLIKIAPEYLIRRGNGTAETFKNKRELLKLFPEKEKVNNLIDQQKLSIKNEQDLATIISHLNQK